MGPGATRAENTGTRGAMPAPDGKRTQSPAFPSPAESENTTGSPLRTPWAMTAELSFNR